MTRGQGPAGATQKLFYSVLEPFGARNDGTPGQAPAIQAAIDQAASDGGGEVFLPAGFYQLSGVPLIPRRGVSIRGVYPGVTPLDGRSWDLGFMVATGTILMSPGSYIFQHAPAAGLGTAAAIDGVHISRLGVSNAAGIVTCGASSSTGLASAVFEDILADTISSVAFDLTNPMHIHGRNLKASGVNQLLRITSDYDTTVINNQPGNCRFDDLYAYLSAAGMANPSVHLRALDTSGHGTALNYIHMSRLQVNRFSGTSQAADALYLQGARLGVPINGCTFDGLDLEGYCLHRLETLFAYGNRFIFAGSAQPGQVPSSDIYMRSSLYNQMHNQDVNVVLDMDDTASPLLWFGHLKSVVSNRYPLGLWWDSTKAGGAQLGLERLAPWDNSTFGVTAMPQTDLSFGSAGGGGIRDKESDLAAATVTIAASNMGFHKGTFAGASTNTLPDATLVPRRTCKIIQTTAFTMTVNTQLSQTINGAASIALTQWQAATLQSDGTNWLRLS